MVCDLLCLGLLAVIVYDLLCLGVLFVLLVYLGYWFAAVAFLIDYGELMFVVWLCCFANSVGVIYLFLCVCDLVLVCLVGLFRDVELLLCCC